LCAQPPPSVFWVPMTGPFCEFFACHLCPFVVHKLPPQTTNPPAHFPLLTLFPLHFILIIVPCRLCFHSTCFNPPSSLLWREWGLVIFVPQHFSWIQWWFLPRVFSLRRLSDPLLFFRLFFCQRCLRGWAPPLPVPPPRDPLSLFSHDSLCVLVLLSVFRLKLCPSLSRTPTPTPVPHARSSPSVCLSSDFSSVTYSVFHPPTDTFLSSRVLVPVRVLCAPHLGIPVLSPFLRTQPPAATFGCSILLNWTLTHAPRPVIFFLLGFQVLGICGTSLIPELPKCGLL